MAVMRSTAVHERDAVLQIGALGPAMEKAD
jgi:hypothetical protein